MRQLGSVNSWLCVGYAYINSRTIIT
ncbi:protein of unknown function [Candidatus Promineifilum breve]|uniref:Uncharacterized protein n=1 Tax=Candidatus Promineifilum breve TaxID=1806508 RepID=A0A160SZF8_9CHLR|nr:protein of unknown function [Candidatus Promineifilum breve]